MNKPDKLNALNKATFSHICAASATPPGQSGLAVLRLSGAGCAQAADLIFKAFGSPPLLVNDMPGYTCAYGKIVDPISGDMIDQVVLTRFAAPHSYTGEDVVEISCHGGLAVKQAILDSLFSLGISPAEPGEFTKRAFINGKLDLVQAEAVMDLIQASAQKTSRAAAAQLQGSLSKRMKSLTSSLYMMQAELELILEFPEHDDVDTVATDLTNRLQQLMNEIGQLTQTYKQGRLLREGLTVAIAGRPNAGKSSLLNALAGYDRAIVTPIAGTTRDTIEEMIDINGLPVRLIDTAGMRHTDDLVEQQGVARARTALTEADLVFWLISPPLDNFEDEKEMMIQMALPNMKIIVGKEDLADSKALYDTVAKALSNYELLTFSAMKNEGLTAIRKAITDYYEQAGSGAHEDLLITNHRHQQQLTEASDYLAQACQALQQQIPLDMIASLLRNAAEALASVTGEHVSDTLVDTIFSRFCVGK